MQNYKKAELQHILSYKIYKKGSAPPCQARRYAPFYSFFNQTD